MRFLVILLLLASVYFILTKRNSKSPEPAAVISSTPVSSAEATPTPPENSNVLKRPLDRTHEVLDQARKNNQDGF